MVATDSEETDLQRLAMHVRMFISTAILTIIWRIILGADVFRWKPSDDYGKINALYNSLYYKDCRITDKDDLTMPETVVSQVPKFNQMLTRTWYRNRTNLLHLHNMALNRAFFFSFINQKLNRSQEDFNYQPGLMYYYMSATADVNANPNMLNGSSIIFDNNCHYANFLNQLDFNTTIPLFAPSAWRWDDTTDSDNYLREPTKTVVHVEDLGANPNRNYTLDSYKMNPWYQKWLPDTDDGDDSLTKYTYTVGIKYSNVTGHFLTNEYQGYNFFGPANPGVNQEEKELPVQFTRVYYDCRKTNKWTVSATAPIADYMARYTKWTHLRRPR